MDQKQIKRNLLYFTKTDTMLYVGIGLLVVGVALFFLTYSYLAYIIASVCAAVGLVLFLIGASHRVTDADIDACIATLTEGMAVDTVENPKFSKRIQKQIPVLHVHSYLYDDGLHFKYAKSGSIRSDQYEATILYALDTGLYVVRRRISLLCADEIDTQTVEIPYTEIEKLEIVQTQKVLTLRKKPRTVTPTLLCIRGNCPMEIPMQSTADVDEFIQRVHRALTEAKKEMQ